MLQELAIRTFALLEEVRLSFGPGVNVLTDQMRDRRRDTGAGAPAAGGWRPAAAGAHLSQ